jgi:hypothetical protein
MAAAPVLLLVLLSAVASSAAESSGATGARVRRADKVRSSAVAAGPHQVIVELAAPPSTRLAVRVRSCPAPMQCTRVQGRPCWCLLTSRHMHTPAFAAWNACVRPAQVKTTGVTAAAQQASHDEYDDYYASASDGYDAGGDDAYGACGCRACWERDVLSCRRTGCLRTHTCLAPFRCPPRHTSPPCTHAGPVTDKDADGHKTCATLGAACKSNRDCCHDFLCARDPGSYDRRCE